MQWVEVKVVTGRGSVEALSEKILQLGAGGVSVEDALDWVTAKKDGLGDLFPEPAVTDCNMVTIRGYFPLSFLSDGRENALADFVEALPAFGLDTAAFYTRQVDDTDWEQAWKQYWRPTPVGKRLLILPAWLNGSQWPDRLVVRLDPGAAFGTGTHESTRFCLELLEEELSGGETVLDLGCGSGILALAAKLLGAGHALGVDIDETAVRSARENAIRNNMEDVPIIQADLFQEEAWHQLGQADVVTANLTADALLSVKDRLPHVLRPGGRVIASGIIRGREEEVASAYVRAGYQVKGKRSAGEWTAFLLEWKV